MKEALFRGAEQQLWDAVGASPTERRVHLERNGVTVRLQEIGTGPAVLFIHGAMTWGASWATLALRLTGFRCLLLDRPGAGLSEPFATKVDADGLRRFADTLVADVLDALALESAHLVATSYGGAIALRSAAASPERVGRMLQFSCPVGAIRPRSLPMLPLIPFAVLPMTRRRARSLFRHIGNGGSLAAGRIGQEEIDCFFALLRHTDTRRNERATFRTSGGPTRLRVSDAVLARVKAPTYFLWGANDPFAGPSAARQLVSRMPAAELEVLDGAGHAPWFDAPDHSAEVMKAFFGRE